MQDESLSSTDLYQLPFTELAYFFALKGNLIPSVLPQDTTTLKTSLRGSPLQRRLLILPRPECLGVSGVGIRVASQCHFQTVPPLPQCKTFSSSET